jgi:excisionase family DNA binding protein
VYSTKEASEKMGISDSHLRRLLNTKEVHGIKLGHDWVVLSLDYKRKRKQKRSSAEGGLQNGAK